MQEYQQGITSVPGRDGSSSLSRKSAHIAAGSLGLGPARFSDPYLSLSNEFGASPPTGMSALGTSAKAGVASLGGTIGKLFKKTSLDAGLGAGGAPSQKLLGTGAEELIGSAPGPLEVRILKIPLLGLKLNTAHCL